METRINKYVPQRRPLCFCEGGVNGAKRNRYPGTNGQRLGYMVDKSGNNYPPITAAQLWLIGLAMSPICLGLGYLFWTVK